MPNNIHQISAQKRSSLTASYMFILIHLNFRCACTCTLKLPSTHAGPKKIDKTPNITINVKGKVEQGVFYVNSDNIKQVVENEAKMMFSGTGEKIYLNFDIEIYYEWKWTRLISLWAPIGPEGEHTASVEMVCSVYGASTIKEFRSLSEMKAAQSLFSGWKYDLPVSGGIVRYVLKEVVDDIMMKLQQFYNEENNYDL